MTTDTKPRAVTGEARMLIDGEMRMALSGKVYDNINPATEEPVGQVADGDVADLDLAIAAARREADAGRWAGDVGLRVHCLRQLHAALVEAEEELRIVDTSETGRPFARTMGSIVFFTAEIPKIIAILEGYQFEKPLDGGILQREPFGVVGLIFTWNCGFFLNVAKCVMALAAGNAVVVCPAEETPWQTTVFGRIIHDKTDIPAGVVNIVTSTRPEVRQALTADPRVDMVSFTGSTPVASRIMAQCSPTLKKVLLEAGGKSAAVVLDRESIGPAVQLAVGMLVSNAGQTCAALTRLVVPEEFEDEAAEQALAAMGRVQCGDPWDPACGQGPQISARHRDSILRHIAAAKADGSRLLLGGGAPANLDKGYYITPTLFAGVAPSSSLAQNEVFGPVLAMIVHSGDDDAVRIANNSRYGLSGAVFATDTGRALSAARRVQSGQVSVNGVQPFLIGPFGGYKLSGLGREGGVWGFEEYLQIKTIGV